MFATGFSILREWAGYDFTEFREREARLIVEAVKDTPMCRVAIQGKWHIETRIKMRIMMRMKMRIKMRTEMKGAQAQWTNSRANRSA